MSKHTTLSEKLKGYSLLAGSMFASAIAAQGQIIYTNVNPDVELGGSVPVSYPELTTYAVDMNNDGSVDFNINMNIKAPLGNEFSFFEKIDNAGNPSNLIHSYTIEYAPFVFKNDLGDSIPFGPSFYGFVNVNFAFQTAGAVSYIWNNQANKFVGVRFQDGTDNYYGWIRLDVNTNGAIPNIVVKDFAYEQTAGDKIAAGDTGLGLPVNVNQLSKAHSMVVFPNPSNGQVMLKLGEPLTGSVEVSMQDAVGREVYAATLQTNGRQTELPFDFSAFAAGTYFVQVRSADVAITQKLIKR